MKNGLRNSVKPGHGAALCCSCKDLCKNVYTLQLDRGVLSSSKHELMSLLTPHIDCVKQQQFHFAHQTHLANLSSSTSSLAEKIIALIFSFLRHYKGPWKFIRSRPKFPEKEIQSHSPLRKKIWIWAKAQQSAHRGKKKQNPKATGTLTSLAKIKVVQVNWLL